MLFQELTAGETDDGSAELIVKPAGDAESMTLQELNEQPGLVRIFDEDGNVRDEWSFDAFRDVRLAFGLWEKCGPFDLPDDVRGVLGSVYFRRGARGIMRVALGF